MPEYSFWLTGLAFVLNGVTSFYSPVFFMVELENRLGYTFKNKSLLRLALTHCSVQNVTENNQRLEFLGDAVLEHIMSEYIFEKFPRYDEGAMTRLRASIVSEKPLAHAAEKINLSSFVLIGQCLRTTGGANKPSVLSDTLEAIFAAVYLDGGFEEARKVILHVLKDIIENPEERPKDYKTELQELLFKNGTVKVKYVATESSEDSRTTSFLSEVYCNGALLGSGTGTSKKRSEQAAAKAALEKIKK